VSGDFVDLATFFHQHPDVEEANEAWKLAKHNLEVTISAAPSAEAQLPAD
jgi:hypothetical protein